MKAAAIAIWFCPERRMRMVGYFWIAAVIMALGAMSMKPAWSVSFDTRHAREVGANPHGMSLSLRCRDGQHVFHCGERIALHLTVRLPRHRLYQVSAEDYERDLFLGQDKYICDKPAHAIDPEPYPFPTFIGLSGNEMQGMDTIRSRYDYEQDLNEWLAFDKPGTFRVYVRTDRVAPWRNGPGSWVTSNVITIKIVPAGNWATREFNRALNGSNRDVGRPLHLPTCPADMRTRSQRRMLEASHHYDHLLLRISLLRYLRSPEAVNALAVLALQGHLGKIHFENDRVKALGEQYLAEMPERAQVLNLLRNWITGTGNPVIQDHLIIYANVMFRSHHPTVTGLSSARFEKLSSEVNEDVNQAVVLLRQALPKKVGAAKTVCARTIQHWPANTDWSR